MHNSRLNHKHPPEKISRSLDTPAVLWKIVLKQSTLWRHLPWQPCVPTQLEKAIDCICFISHYMFCYSWQWSDRRQPLSQWPNFLHQRFQNKNIFINLTIIEHVNDTFHQTLRFRIRYWRYHLYLWGFSANFRSTGISQFIDITLHTW
jgi:hypothetical protein